MRCGSSSPLPSQRTRPKRKATPSEISFDSFVPFSPSRPPLSQTRTHLLVDSPHPSSPQSRLCAAGDPKGGRVRPLTPAPGANPIAGSRAQFEGLRPRSGRISDPDPLPGPSAETWTPPRLPPRTPCRPLHNSGKQNPTHLRPRR